jgi:hypothetical protein
MKDTLLKIKAPQIFAFDDYHEIEEKDDFVKALNKDLRVVEVSDKNAQFNGNYYGLLYLKGSKPTTTLINWMISLKVAE